MNKKTIDDNFLINFFGKEMLELGYSFVPNALIKYKNRLGLTGNEFEFIVRLINAYMDNKTILRDRDLGKKSYTRERTQLYAKGYLTYETKTFLKNKEKITGTIYNLLGLKKAIIKLIEEDKTKQNTNIDNHIPKLFDDQ